MKRPTQADVARIAGVSRATVSYVLNDQTEQKIPISAETRKRVLHVIAELGYEVDARGQSLRSGDTRTIGVLLPMYENPYFWQVLLGISAEAETAGYSVLLSHNSLTHEQEIRSLKELAQLRVDGLILLTNFKLLPPRVLAQLRKSTRPIVEMAATGSEFDHVIQSYVDSTVTLMTYLFELGHTRIGFVYGVVEEWQGHDRLLTYKEALVDAGITIDDSLVQTCGPLMEDGYQTALQLLKRPDRPTALLVINDLLAMAVLRAAADLKLRVPEDLSVASFDDIPFIRYTVPRLTTVTGHPYESGRQALKLLVNRLRAPECPPQVAVIESQLIVRESTGPAPM